MLVRTLSLQTKWLNAEGWSWTHVLWVVLFWILKYIHLSHSCEGNRAGTLWWKFLATITHSRMRWWDRGGQRSIYHFNLCGTFLFLIMTNINTNVYKGQNMELMTFYTWKSKDNFITYQTSVAIFCVHLCIGTLGIKASVSVSTQETDRWWRSAV